MLDNTQQVEVLKEALLQARTKLVLQDKMLKRLTAAPLCFATVIAVKKEEPVTVAAKAPKATRKKAPKEADKRKKFVEGDIVRITRGDYEGEEGRIVTIDDRQAKVELPEEGRVVCVAISGSDESDRVTLVSKKGAIKSGTKVKVTAGRMRGHVGKITLEPDEMNRVVVHIGKGLCLDCRDSEVSCEHEYYLTMPPAMEMVTPAEEAAAESDTVEAAAEPLGTAIVLFEGKEVEVALLPDKEVKVGDTAKLSMQTLQMVDVIETKFAGEIVGVQRVLDNASSEVDFQGGTRAVYNGKFEGQLKTGDQVVLDSSGLAIIRNLGQEDQKDDIFAFTQSTNVDWNDIGGLDAAKRELIEAIELPYRFGGFYKFYRKNPLKGVLLYGPPGCGKTMLGKAAATALSTVHVGKGAETAFMYVKAPEILNKFVGASEATIRRIFAAGRKHRETYGYPAVIFIDEADAILYKRGSGVSSDIERTIVPTFLAEMDGFEEAGAIVMLATNRPDTLDPAIVREGRISRKIKVARPNQQVTTDLFHLKLGGLPLYNGSTHRKLSTDAARDVFNPHRVLYQVTTSDNAMHPFTLGHICSGAMVAEIVDQATSVALHRDIKAGKRRGLKADDLKEAVNRAFSQNADLNHDDDVQAFVENLGKPVLSVHRPFEV